MTLSNPSPDTGAGTPHVGVHRAGYRSDCPACIENDATLDAARPATDPAGYDDRTYDGRSYHAGYRAAIEHRPATDPAGLDVDAALDALTDDDVMYDRPVAMSGEPMDPVLFVRFDAIKEALARLSVADGPGPEERLDEFQCGQCGDWLLPEHLEGHCAAEGRLFAALPEHREETGRS